MVDSHSQKAPSVKDISAKLMPTKDDLIRELTKAQYEIQQLKDRLLEPEDSAGSAAERFVAGLVRGERSLGKTMEYDVRSLSKKRLEIKFSKLGIPNKGSHTRRWTWGRPLGNAGAKRYDRLILLGQVDPQFMDQYADPTPEYVIFDVPFLSVKTIMRKDPIIQFTTSPSARTGSTAEKMFARYEISAKDLRKRYGTKK